MVVLFHGAFSMITAVECNWTGHIRGVLQLITIMPPNANGQHGMEIIIQ